MAKPIEMPDVAVIGNVENVFEEYFKNNPNNGNLIIDLSNVIFTDIVTLVYISSFIYSRHTCNFATYLKLPLSNDVKFFLHTWRFFEIIEELTGKNIRFFLLDNYQEINKNKIKIGKKYFYNIFTDHFKNKYEKDDGITSLLDKGFFSLFTIPFNTIIEKSLALKEETEQWRKESENLIVSVLKNHLQKNLEDDNIFANTIIYETLTNCARHPQSSMLVMGSYLDMKRNSKSAKGRHFTIVIWDNGNSIIDTLKAVLNNNSNNKIRSQFSYDYAIKQFGYDIKFYKKHDSNIFDEMSVMNSDFIPNKDSSDLDVLLSSFLPGISRDPSGKDNPYDVSFVPGLGLTLLLDAVVNKLKGTLSVRVNNYFLHIQSAPKKIISGYQTKFNEKPEYLFLAKSTCFQYSPPFKGNMITLRIELDQ